jgi:hypothetical protein
MEFNQQSSATGNRELIPGGTLAWGIITVKGINIGKPKDDKPFGSRYAECELTICDGQYTRRKVFTNVGDPTYEHNSEEYKKMGYGALSRMLESSGLVNVQDPQSYSKVNGQSFDTLMAWLDGKRIAFKVKLSKGTQGYPDKNEVGEYLSPNPISSSFKDFQKLMQQANMPAVAAPAAAPAPSWGAGSGTSAPAAAAPATTGATPPATNPANPPAASWLQQAQGK